ncbi:3,4-dihydroxy-2-butanone 4-phosphate synthase [subsurface metagenome]
MQLFDRIEKAVEQFQKRKFIIVFSEKEGEGDLCLPAEAATAATLIFMARVASGILALALPRKRLEELEIEPLSSRYRHQDTPFFMPVDSLAVKTGSTAADRAMTVRKIIDPHTKPSDLARPGHLPLLGAEPLGLLKRDGHTEAATEICQLAGLYPGALLCELISDRGDAMNVKELRALAKKLRVPLITVGALTKFARTLLKKT